MIYLFGNKEKLDVSLSFKYFLKDRCGSNELTFYPVYKIRPIRMVDQDELDVLAEIFDAKDMNLPEGGFFLKPANGQVTPWGLKYSQMVRDLKMRTIGQVDRYFYCYLEGKPIDLYTRRLVTDIFLPEVYYRDPIMEDTKAKPGKPFEWLYVEDLVDDRIKRILTRYGLEAYDLDAKKVAKTITNKRITACELLALCNVKDDLKNIHHKRKGKYIQDNEIVIRPSNFHYNRVEASKYPTICGKREDMSLAKGMKVAGYNFFELTQGGRIEQFFVIMKQLQKSKRSWSDFSQLAGYPIPFIRVVGPEKSSVAIAAGSQYKLKPKEDLNDASIILLGVSKMSRLRLSSDIKARQDQLLVPEPNYLNPEIMRRFQAIFLRLKQMETGGLLHVMNLTRLGLVYHLTHFAKSNNVGFHVEVDEIPLTHPDIRFEDMLYQPWNDALALIISKHVLAQVIDILDREVCPYRVVGAITENQRMILRSEFHGVNLFDQDTKEFSQVSSNYDVEIDSEKVCKEEGVILDGNVQQKLLDWLYYEDFLDPSASFEFVDASCYGSLVQGMKVGPWQTAVNQVVVTGQDHQWQAATLFSYHANDVEHLMGMIRIRMCQYGINMKDITLFMMFPESTSTKLIEQFLSEGFECKIDWKYEKNLEDVVVYATASIPQDTAMISPYIKMDKGGELYCIITKSQKYRDVDKAAKVISKIVKKGYIGGFVALDQCIWGALLRVLFASRVGADASIPDNTAQWLQPTLGAMVQIYPDHLKQVSKSLSKDDFHFFKVASLHKDMGLTLDINGQNMKLNVSHLRKIWSKEWFAHMVTKAREQDEYFSIDQFISQQHPGLAKQILPKVLNRYQGDISDLRIAIVRDRGSFGHFHVARALDSIGITVSDLTLKDLIDGTQTLRSFHGLIFPGGSTYGDEGTAGQCTAKKILAHKELCQEFEQFFIRPDTLTVGFGNGGQILAHLQKLIPNAHWPLPMMNPERSFLSRKFITEVSPSPSVVLKDLIGCQLMASFGHRYGRIKQVRSGDNIALMTKNPQMESFISIEYNPTQNANGAYAFTSDDGRITWFLCHPEYHMDRGKYDYFDNEWPHDQSPWIQIFHSMVQWLIDNKIPKDN